MSTLNIDPVFITERLTGSCRDVHRAVGCKLQHELDPHDRNWLDWEILVIGLYRDSAQPPTSFHPKKLFHLASFVFSSLYKYPPLSFSICFKSNAFVPPNPTHAQHFSSGLLERRGDPPRFDGSGGRVGKTRARALDFGAGHETPHLHSCFVTVRGFQVKRICPTQPNPHTTLFKWVA